MLVLSRRVNESIVIGGNVTVTVLEVKGDHVRIGIDAPREISVHRQEVAAQIMRANREASGATGADLRLLPRRPPAR